VLGVESWFVVRQLGRPRFAWDLRFARRLTGAALPFLGMDALIALTSSITVVLLSVLQGEGPVGLFSAAIQLTVPLTLVFRSVTLGFFPVMCRKFGSDLAGVTLTIENLMALLVSLALSAATAMFILANDLLVLLYQERSFAAAAPVLRIIVWQLVLISLTSVLGQMLLAAGRERLTLGIVGFDLVATAAASAALIVSVGVTGAAAATLSVAVVDFFLHFVLVARLLPHLSLVGVLWRPAVTAACVALTLAAAGHSGFVTRLGFAAATYVVVVLGLELTRGGGLRGLRAHYRYLSPD
jgi:O-antigen/teichoic acid export membrane protein